MSRSKVIERTATLVDLEQFLIERVRLALNAWGVEVVAEPVPDYLGAAQRDRMAVIFWAGDSVDSPVNRLGRVHLSRRFRVLLTVKTLQSHRDGYRMVDDLLAGLTALYPQDAVVGVPTSAGLVGFRDGGYSYEVEVSFSTFIGGRTDD